MGLFSWLSKSDQAGPVRTSQIYNSGWIDVYFSYVVARDPKEDEKQIQKSLEREAQKIVDMCSHQREIRTGSGNVLAHHNEVIEGREISKRIPLGSGLIARPLSRSFGYEIEKLDEKRLKVKISVQSKYSPREIIDDMASLNDLRSKISVYMRITDENEGIVIPGIDFDKHGEQMYFEVQGVMTLSCAVKDRLELSAYNKQVEGAIFQEGYDLIRGIQDQESKSPTKISRKVEKIA